MGANVAASRYLRTTLVSGSVYEADTVAGAAAVDTTINSYALAGLITTIQFVPTTTQTVTATVPTAPSTAAGKGWRDKVAEDATNQITWDAVNWTVRVRMLASQSQSCLTTVILYRQNGAGTTEIGRGTDTTTLTTTIATITITVAAATGLVFAAGDKIQIEIYTTTLTLGVATAPTTATTITCRVGESEANSGSKYTPATYTKQFVRSMTTAVSLVGAGARRITGARSFTTALSLVGAVRKTVLIPRASALALVSVVQKNVRTTKTAALVLTGAVQKTALIPRTAALVLTGVAARQVAAFRSFTTALSLGTVFARAVISARSFTTTLTLVASGLVQMPLVVLNRIVGGGGAVVKKIINIFED